MKIARRLANYSFCNTNHLLKWTISGQSKYYQMLIDLLLPVEFHDRPLSFLVEPVSTKATEGDVPVVLECIVGPAVERGR